MPTDNDGFAYLHIVRYHEVDPQAHVYHSRYLEIADAGFSDYLVQLVGVPYSRMATQGFDPALVATQITFHAPARYEDRLRVYVTPTRIGTSSFEMRISIIRAPDQQAIATVTTTYVNYDVASEGARPIPGSIAEILRASVDATDHPEG